MRKSKMNITLNRQRNLQRYILTFPIELPQQLGNILCMFEVQKEGVSGFVGIKEQRT